MGHKYESRALKLSRKCWRKIVSETRFSCRFKMVNRYCLVLISCLVAPSTVVRLKFQGTFRLYTASLLQAIRSTGHA